MLNNDRISRSALLAAYDAAHKGPPGGARKLIEEAPGVDGWISVKDRLPPEIHSIFWPWYGRKEWSNAMWREQSDKVLVTVTFKDGTRLVTTGETHDGEWRTSISKTLNPIVTHWMQMPEPPKEDNDAYSNH